jgi:heat shock protein HslJ
MRKFLLFPFALVVFSLFCGWSSVRNTAPAICNIKWHPENAPAEAFLAINPYGRVAGSTGDNRFFAPAVFSENNGLSFGALMMTKRFGPNHQFEVKLIDSLSKSSSYQHRGNMLILYDADGNEVMRFFYAGRINPQTLN